MSEETASFVPGAQKTSPESAAAGPGTTLDPFPGEFRVLRFLGAGRFGEVYLAEDLSPLGRLVALKFLRGADADEQALALNVLANDARALAALHHPNIVAVHAWRDGRRCGGPMAGRACLVLQYVSGGSLDDRLRRDGPFPWQLAARYVADVAEGLLQAHRRGIVHRDIKPANILWDLEADEALLTDFGIAARLADTCPAGGGTPLFMAPEAFDNVLSPALDVYSLAASLFYLAAAAPPFAAHNESALRALIERGLPRPDPRCAVLPAALEELIRAGLSARPQDRPTLAEFARTLRGSLNQLLADALGTRPLETEPTPPVELRLLVSRQVDGRTSVPVAASRPRPEYQLRDFKRVPRPPERIVLHTGDRVRIEVEADQAGYVTVFNVGPTGNLNLLYPTELAASPPPLPARSPLHLVDVEATPPAGQERLFALWTREPLPLRAEDLLSLAKGGEVPGPYRATRDMVRVQRSLQQLAPADRHAVVLELDHL
jgi:serine/threonine protein kinase